MFFLCGLTTHYGPKFVLVSLFFQTDLCCTLRFTFTCEITFVTLSRKRHIVRHSLFSGTAFICRNNLVVVDILKVSDNNFMDSWIFINFLELINSESDRTYSLEFFFFFTFDYLNQSEELVSRTIEHSEIRQNDSSKNMETKQRLIFMSPIDFESK